MVAHNIWNSQLASDSLRSASAIDCVVCEVPERDTALDIVSNIHDK